MRRRKTKDYAYDHEVAIFAGSKKARCRIRIYEAEGELPVIVCTSLPENRNVGITMDAERIAAEVALADLPEEARKAKKREPFFFWIEHYSHIHVSSGVIGETFDMVEFGDYRAKIGGGRRVRNAQKALRDYTRAGSERVTFGHPRWTLATREQVEGMIGTTLGEAKDAPARFLTGDLPDVAEDDQER